MMHKFIDELWEIKAFLPEQPVESAKEGVALFSSAALSADEPCFGYGEPDAHTLQLQMARIHDVTSMMTRSDVPNHFKFLSVIAERITLRNMY